MSKKASSTFFQGRALIFLITIAVHIYLVSSNPANHMHGNCCY